MSELRECPFCGGAAELVNYGLTGGLRAVQCLDCGARTRVFDPDVKRGENACDAWNRRAMIDAREPTKEERKQDIKFLTHILMEIRDYAISCGQEADDTLKSVAEWILRLLKVATFNGEVEG